MIDALRLRYPGDRGWIFLNEVSNDNATRRADCIALDCWHGVAIGHELKRSRSDWLRELGDLTKRDFVEEVCSRRWIVAPKGIVLREELPVGWGLLEAGSTGKLRQTIAAPPHRVPPLPLWITRCIGKFALADLAQKREMTEMRTRLNGERETALAAQLAAREEAILKREQDVSERSRQLDQTWNEVLRLSEDRGGYSYRRQTFGGYLRSSDIASFAERVRARAASVVAREAGEAAAACNRLAAAAEADALARKDLEKADPGTVAEPEPFE